MRLSLLLTLCSLLLAACGTPAAPVTPQLVNVYVTSAAYPRVDDLYACAPPSIVLAQSDAASAEFSMRLGEPVPLLTPAFQVGAEDILVVNHPQAGVGSLSLDQVQGLFSGSISNWKEVGGNDLPILVWVFAADDDVQQVFDRLVMHGRSITSLARLAVSSQYMSDSVGATSGSIGLLPRRWKTGNTREAFKAGTVPVLIVTRTEPSQPLKTLINCLQDKQ